MNAAARLAFLAALCMYASVAEVSPARSRSAGEKLDRIVAMNLPPRTTIILSEDEINSYLRYDYAPQLPPGISQPRFRLEPESVTGAAVVDFIEWQAAQGSSPGALLRWLLRGKRPVEATCRYTSSDGYGRVDVESARIGGIALSGDAVHFLIEHMVQPRYPAAVVGRREPIGYNLRQVNIGRGRAVLVTQ